MLLGALGVAALLLVFYAFSFGFTRLLLRRTGWAQYSLEAPFLTGAALLILVLSAFGYYDPHELPAWRPWTLLFSGLVVSLAVVIWDRVELCELMRTRWQRCLIVTLPSCLAAGVFLSFFPGNVWDDIHIPWIEEYIEYATLATVLTGQHQGEPGTLAIPFAVDHHRIRIGQDLLVASVAQVTGLHPMQVVIPLAVLLRFQQAIMLGLLLCSIAYDLKAWKLIVAVLVLDAVLVTEVMFFATSFFSSNCTTPLCAIYFVWLATQREFGWRECIIVVLMNLFFFLTYPEFLIITKAFEGFCLALAWWRGKRQTWVPLVLCNLAFFAIHPLAILSKAQTLRAHLSYGGGWSVLGDPITHTTHFISGLLGMRFGTFATNPLREVRSFTWVVIAVILALIVTGLFLLARRYRLMLPLLAWLAIVVGTHVASGYKYGHYYAGFKSLSHTYFVVMLAAAAPLLLMQAGWGRRLALSGLAVWLVAAGVSSRKLIHDIRHDGYTTSFTELRDALRTYGGGQDIAVVCRHQHPLRLVNLAIGETGERLAVLTKVQHHVLDQRGFTKMLDCRSTPPNALLFEGILVTDGHVLEKKSWTLDDRMVRLEADRVLCRVGEIVLCKGRVYAATSTEFPKFHWIRDDCSSSPAILALSSQLRLRGEVSEYHTLPYHFTCRVDGLQWSREIVVDRAGPFEAVMELPDSVVGRSIAVQFKDYGTFRPSECMRGSSDTRALGFMLTSVEFAKQDR